VWSKTEIGARVRKSRRKEAAGAADTVLMQIEWSEAGDAPSRDRCNGVREEIDGEFQNGSGGRSIGE